MTVGIPFGPNHPYKPTKAKLSANGKKGAASSPWSKSPMILTKRAAIIFAERHKGKTP